MTNIKSEIEKYGSLEAYQAEMKRRGSLVKNRYSHFSNVSKEQVKAYGRAGLQKRWANAKSKANAEEPSQADSQADN